MHMHQSKQQAGFTLVEMAVVLIIIGLIIGAVLKGQDLIENARAKQFANFVRQAEVAAFAFYDRNGRYPGDAFIPGSTSNPDGIIGNEATADLESIWTVPNTVTNFEASKRIGTETYYINFGTVGSLDGGTTVVDYPCIIVTKYGGSAAAAEDLTSADTDYVFADAELEYLKAFDTAIDGLADGTTGKVVGATTVDLLTGAVMDYSDDGSTATFLDATAATPETYDNTDCLAQFYFFDRGKI